MWIDAGRLWSCVTRVEHLKVLMQMIKMPPLQETAETYDLNMTRWNMGIEPVTGRYYADFIAENASSWREAWREVMGDDAVLRTSDRYDCLVTHLGYQSVSVCLAVSDVLREIITTDGDIIKASQDRLRKVEVIPEEQVSGQVKKHLAIARKIVDQVFQGLRDKPEVYMAMIPPASDRVRTAGLYSTTTGEIYISMDMMARGSTMIDTLIHEMAHHQQYLATGEASDLTESHADAMTKIAAEVVRLISRGELDEWMKGVRW